MSLGLMVGMTTLPGNPMRKAWKAFWSSSPPIALDKAVADASWQKILWVKLDRSDCSDAQVKKLQDYAMKGGVDLAAD